MFVYCDKYGMSAVSDVPTALPGLVQDKASEWIIPRMAEQMGRRFY